MFGKSFLNRLVIGLFGCVSSVLISSATEPVRQGDEPLTFEKHVRPILKAHCFHCHGEAGVMEAELDVRLRRWLVRGGDSGEALVPGDAESSLLIERMVSGEMPPGDEQVASEEIAIIQAWIQQGAITARPEPESLSGGDYFTQEERSFWSFQPIRRPQVPIPVAEPDDRETQKQIERLNGPVDAFIYHKLKLQGLRFSPIADRYTLIRRLTFDLLGVPPTQAMVDQFLDDASPKAYERLVDRLLASPAYGERWGRHWLDVAGYADSDGYTERDVEREFAYFYRDYVIESLNHDKPFSKFVWEQLAGDEILGTEIAGDDLTEEQIATFAATGFLRMAPDGTSAGGVDRAEAANQNIADTIQITSSALLGLTVGCARCHDHRYDPISQADYYRMRAIFEPALDWKQWKTPTQRRVSLYTQSDRTERDEIEQRAKAAEAERLEKQADHISRTLYEELLVVPDEQRLSLKEAYETEKSERTEQQVALLEEYPSVGNISPGSLYLYAQQRARRAGDIERVAKEKESRFLSEATLARTSNLTEDQQQQLAELLETSAEQWSEGQKRLVEDFADVMVTKEQLAEVNPEAFATLEEYREAAEICRSTDAKTDLAKLQDEIKAIRATAPKEHFVRVLQEPPSHTPKTFLFIRGDHQQPEREMEPSELTVLRREDYLPLPLNDMDLPTTGRRLAYAKHLTSAQHPLLSRVIMNRVWMHHFGRGIVATPGDFGRLGAKPTHPELLDWLASEFISSGWSLKRIHKFILCSHTYQQQSIRNDQLDQVDPDNLWLARMPVRRLESESVRDAMLWASGELLPELYGPPTPVKEDSVGQIVVGKEMLDGERKPTGADTASKGAYRRSLYIQARRSRPLAVLESFDLPIASPNCEIRVASNVATQSLMMMNSQFAIDRSQFFAKQLIARTSNPDEQLELAWCQCFSTPMDEEVKRDFQTFLAQQKEAYAKMDEKRDDSENEMLALASVCQAMMSSNAFLYVD